MKPIYIKNKLLAKRGKTRLSICVVKPSYTKTKKKFKRILNEKVPFVIRVKAIRVEANPEIVPSKVLLFKG